jgi:hypothetical protein
VYSSLARLGLGGVARRLLVPGEHLVAVQALDRIEAG